MADNSFIILDVDLIVAEVIKRTQLRSRTMPDEGVDRIVLTEDDRDSIDLYLSDAEADIGNKTGSLGTMEITTDEVVYELSEKQTEDEVKKAHKLLKKAVVNYVLTEWYRQLGMASVAAEHMSIYERAVLDFRFNSQQDQMVTPKYRPYF
nr:hypothetical protein 7 [Balneolaceae bacterium]